MYSIKPEKGERETQWIEGTVAVTRSPMIHPGDSKFDGGPTMLYYTDADKLSVKQ